MGPGPACPVRSYACWAFSMLLASLFHVTCREWRNIGLNIVLGALAFGVAYGRLVIEPF